MFSLPIFNPFYTIRLEKVLFYAKYTRKKEKNINFGLKKIWGVFWGTKCEKLHF